MKAPFQRRDKTTGRLLIDRWYYEFRHRGVRYCGNAPSKQEAATAMKAKRTEIFKDEAYETAHGHKPFKPTPMILGEFADEYFRTCCANKKSAERDRQILARLKKRWPYPLADVTAQMVADTSAKPNASLPRCGRRSRSSSACSRRHSRSRRSRRARRQTSSGRRSTTSA